ncbi:MAG: hypothetical protein AABX23_03525 [Nanoarchaeota archaeon]
MGPEASRPNLVALVVENPGQKYEINLLNSRNLREHLDSMNQSDTRLIASYMIMDMQDFKRYIGEVSGYLQSREPGEQLTQREIDAYLRSGRQSLN